MADAKKCDLCGKLYEDYDAHSDSSVKVPTNFTAISFKLFHSAVNGTVIDFCPDCHDAIVNKMIELKNGIKEDKPETLRDWVNKNYPNAVRGSFMGGVNGCPSDYPLLKNHFKKTLCNKKCGRGNKEACAECWDQPYIEDSKK